MKANDCQYMNETLARGYLYLIQRYSLNVCELYLQSFATESSIKKVVQSGHIVKTYYPIRRFRHEDSWQWQVTFALRYEGVNMEVLKAFFDKTDSNEVERFILAHPLGAVQKRVWFLYEYLTGKTLNIQDGEGGSYTPLIDDAFQYALPDSSSIRVRRYHILNNLIGNRDFAPYIRKTAQVLEFSSNRLKAESENLLKNYSSELLYRAVQYLYIKETKSSFAIERETPDQRRMDAFVAILRSMSDMPLTKETLITVQNSVVDARYRQTDWRSDQVYVGETLAPGIEKVHYVAPKPDAIASIMEGFLRCMEQWMAARECDPVVAAAVLSFAFVFLHPFDDGNGRVHRFLMHAILAQSGFVPHGLIFPVSAVMLKHQLDYDKALETFSNRVMSLLDYDIDDRGEVSVRNDSSDFYRAIDYTPIVEYFQQVIVRTIRTEWKTELDYLKAYDKMREVMRNIVDMPDKKANQFILFVRQNGGRLSQRKRQLFPELHDHEIFRLETAIAEVGVGAKTGEMSDVF